MTPNLTPPRRFPTRSPTCASILRWRTMQTGNSTQAERRKAPTPCNSGTDCAREDRYVVDYAPPHQFFPHRLGRVLRQQSRKTLAPNVHGAEFRHPLGPLDALIDPAEYVLPQEEEHPHLGVSPRQQSPLQVVRIRPFVGNQARHHERGFRTFQQRVRRDALVEWMEDERRQFPNRFPQNRYGRTFLSHSLISAVPRRTLCAPPPEGRERPALVPYRKRLWSCYYHSFRLKLGLGFVDADIAALSEGLAFRGPWAGPC